MANRPKRTLKADEKFFRSLAESGGVMAACRVAGYARRTAYEWREADPQFAADWDDALETYAEALEAEADRRAVNGVDKGVYYQGARIDTVKDYSDGLLQMRLKALKPDKYRERFQGEIGGTGGGPVAFTLTFVSPKDGKP